MSFWGLLYPQRAFLTCLQSRNTVLQKIKLALRFLIKFMSFSSFMKWLHLHNYFNLHVCPSFRRRWRRRRRRPTFDFQIPAVISVKKVAWYVLKVKNMHSWAPPDQWGPWDEEKLSYIHYNIRREEAKQCIIKVASVFHHLPSVGPKQLCALAHLGCTLGYFFKF